MSLWEDDTSSGTGAHEQTLKRRRQLSLKNEILRRRSVVKDLNKELFEWQRKQEGDDAKSSSTHLFTEKYRGEFHKYLCYVTRSNRFENAIMCTIFANAICIAIESSAEPGAYENDFVIADLVFLVIYFFEFVLKVICDRVDYFRDPYNRFDFLILLFSFLGFAQLILKTDSSFLGNLTYIRAARAARALRSISFIRALRVLVNALIKTLGSIINLLIVLLLIMYVFAIMGFYFFGPSDDEGYSSSAQQWSGIDSAMFILFDYVTADGWTEFQNDLDERGYKASRFFTAAFIFIGHFIFTNLFIGVIISNLHEAQEDEFEYQKVKREALVRAKKDILLDRQSKDLNQLAEHKTKLSTQQIIGTLAGKLRSDDFVPMQHLTCNTQWIDTYLTSMQHQERTMHRVQRLHFEIAQVLAELLESRFSDLTGW